MDGRDSQAVEAVSEREAEPMKVGHQFQPCDVPDYCEALVWDADGKRTCGEPRETHPAAATGPDVEGERGKAIARVIAAAREVTDGAALEFCDARIPYETYQLNPDSIPNLRAALFALDQLEAPRG